MRCQPRQLYLALVHILPKGFDISAIEDPFNTIGVRPRGTVMQLGCLIELGQLQGNYIHFTDMSRMKYEAFWESGAFSNEETTLALAGSVSFFQNRRTNR